MPTQALQALLQRARREGVALWAEHGEVRFRSEGRAVPEELLGELRAHRVELLQYFSCGESSGEDPTYPLFRARSSPRAARVFSFRHTTWEGIRSGLVKIDSTNGTHWVARIRGSVDADALERSCEDLVQRHDALRARAFESEGRPCVSFGDAAPWGLQRIDLSGVAAAIQEDTAREVASSLVWQPFDLEKGPPFRTFILTLTPSDHVVGIVAHHFMADMMSVTLLRRELLTAYRARCAGHSPLLGAPVVQYSDYLSVMHEWLYSPASAPHLTYWRERLGGATPMVLQAASQVAPDGGRVPIEVSAELASAIYRSARDMHVTAFVVLLAAQYVLLARWCESDDITVGTVTLGREVPPLQQVVGYLADRVYYRASLAGNPEFREVVSRVLASMLEADNHQFVRSDIVKRIAGGAAGRIVAPIFNFTPAPAPETARSPAEALPSGFAIRPPSALSATHPEMCYWLALRETPSGMSGHFRFGGTVIPDLAAAYIAVLSQAVGSPELRLQRFRLSALAGV